MLFVLAIWLNRRNLFDFFLLSFYILFCSNFFSLMKITVESSALKFASDYVGVAISDKTSSHPILTNILLIIDPNACSLILYGSDNEMILSSVVSLPPQPMDLFQNKLLSVAIPYRLYKNVINALSSDPLIEIDITYNSPSIDFVPDPAGVLPDPIDDISGYVVTFMGVKQTFVLHSHDGTDFPVFPTVAECHDVSPVLNLSSTPFLSSLSQIRYCISNDPGKPALNGVKLSFSFDSYDAIASDGHRLVSYTQKDIPLSIQSEAEEISSDLIFSFLLSSKNVTGLMDLCKDSDFISFQIAPQEGLFYASNPLKSAVFRTISSPFPDTTGLIPSLDDLIYRFSFDRKELISHLKHLTAFVSNNPFYDYLRIEPIASQNEVIFSCVDKQLGAGNYILETDLDPSLVYPPIVLRLKYFQESLSSIADPSVCLYYISPTKPVLLSPLSSNPLIDSFHLLMPCSRS